MDDLNNELRILLLGSRVVPCQRLGVQTREATHVGFAVAPGIKNTLPLSDGWFCKYARARLAFIQDTFSVDLARIVELLSTDATSRRAYILNFDFAWKDHDPCNMIYQFLIRNGKLWLIVYLRSSDVAGVLPLDILTAIQIQASLAEKLKVKPSAITFFVGSAHVYEKDAINFLGKPLVEQPKPSDI
jgi:thymidylate synthase